MSTAMSVSALATSVPIPPSDAFAADGDGGTEASVSNSAFLRELGAGAHRGSVLWTTAFYGNPDGNTGWGGAPYEGPDREARIDACSDRNTYFSTAALRPMPGEPLLRRLSCFDRLLAIVVDDPVVADLNGQPSWVLRTSPGKYQVGLFLEPTDPDCADLRKVTALVTSLHSRGLIGGDRSGNNAVRYVRAPCGQNQKPREGGHFQTQLLQWRPGARYTLADAAAVLGIDLDVACAETAAAPTQGAGAFSGEQDEKLQAATASILRGHDLHEAVNTVAASLVASGTAPGAVVNVLRSLMNASSAPRDTRWQARYADIWRSVHSAHRKFREPSVEHGTVDPQTGEVLKEPIFESVRSLMRQIEPIKFVVDGYLEENSIGMAYGPSGCGKTFIALDWACCVATGTPWNGLPVKKGAVFIIAGEGHNGIRRRLMAWAKKYGKVAELEEAPLFVSRHSVNIGDVNASHDLADAIDALESESGCKPVLIVVDTLARNFGTGDENSAKDVGSFIHNCDRYLRRRHAAHVMLIHHTGHNADRARGSSALRAALDQEFQITGFDGRVKLTCTKMKDAPTPPERRFRIVTVDLGQDAAGNPIDGACAVLDGNPWDIEVGTVAGTKEKLTAYTVVREWTQAPIESLAEFVVRFKLSKGTAQRAIEKLEAAGILVKTGNGNRKAWWDLTERTWAEARAMCWVTDAAA